jgi:DNA-binding MarR family transcriptional regulator
MADRRHPANDAWEALMSAHASLTRRFNAEDVWEDLSMKEYDVLYTLSKCPEPIRLTDLNRHVLLSQPALSRMVDRLADQGLGAPGVGRGGPPAGACGCR